MAGEQSVAELILRIVADSSDVRRELEAAVDSEKKFSKDTKESSKEASDAVDNALDKTRERSEKTRSTLDKFGSNLRLISRNMMFLGTTMTAAILGPMAQAAKVNQTVALTFSHLKDTMSLFGLQVAKAAVPAVKDLTDFVYKLYQWFKSLPPEVQENITRVILFGGVALTAAGLVGRLVYILERLHLLWLALPIAAVAAGLAVGKFIEDHTEDIKNFWMRAKAQVSDFWDFIKRGGKPKGPVMEFNIGEGAKTIMKPEASFFGKAVKDADIDLGKIVVKGKKAGKATATAFSEGMSGVQSGLEETLKTFGTWGTMMKQLTMDIAKGMEDTFSSFFFDLFSGQLKTAQEYFASFGKMVLQFIAQLIAKLIMVWMITQIISLIPGGKAVLELLGWSGGGKHEGGEVKKHEGGLIYHLGGLIRKVHEGLNPDEVPLVGQTGEGVLSRNGMASIGGAQALNRINAGESMVGGPTINLIQVIRAWTPEDVYRERKTLSAAMIEELERNGTFRAAMRRYK